MVLLKKIRKWILGAYASLEILVSAQNILRLWPWALFACSLVSSRIDIPRDRCLALTADLLAFCQEGITFTLVTFHVLVPLGFQI
jgi:hypothetical protein